MNKAALTVTANNDSKTYDGVAYSGGNGISYSGFINGESASVLGGTLRYVGSAQGAVNAGSYDLSASGLTSGNYDISYVDGTLTVNKAALTVTANNDTKTYDGVAYAGGNGVSYSGFVNGESASVLGGALRFGGSAQGAVNARQLWSLRLRSDVGQLRHQLCRRHADGEQGCAHRHCQQRHQEL